MNISNKLDRMIADMKKQSKYKLKQLRKSNNRKLGIKEKKPKIDKKVDDKYDIL